jgi:hypothetical protein
LPTIVAHHGQTPERQEEQEGPRGEGRGPLKEGRKPVEQPQAPAAFLLRHGQLFHLRNEVRQRGAQLYLQKGGIGLQRGDQVQWIGHGPLSAGPFEELEIGKRDMRALRDVPEGQTAAFSLFP